MDIYTPGGSIDIAASTVALRQSGSITSESARRAVVAEVTAAALLDIADSLRVVRDEALAAMSDNDPDYLEPTDEAAVTGGEPVADVLTVGDLVTVDGMDEPGEITGYGASEGSIYVDVRFASGAESRAWIETVHRLVGDDGDKPDPLATIDPPAIEIVSAERVIEMAGGITIEPEDPDAGVPAPEPEDLVDDIDADFDGDQHPAAMSALDVLKANEAERKAAKKKAEKSATKKGKKS